jgi:hypothetical protein
MGLLQDIEYMGIGNDDPTKAPEIHTWKNLRTAAINILTDLRKRYMPDLVFSVDVGLENVMDKESVIFFPRMSYFNVIKQIAHRALAYAYIDMPTEQEVKAAKDNDGIKCIDVLRIVQIKEFLDDNAVVSDVLTNDDILTKTSRSKTEYMINSVIVECQSWSVPDPDTGIPKQEPIQEGNNIMSDKNANSVLDYGEITKVISGSQLLQPGESLKKFMGSVLQLFSFAHRSVDVRIFGNPTIEIGDIIEIPEFQKDGIDVRGNYAVNRIITEYDGGLRQTISGRSAGLEPMVYKIRVNITSQVIQPAIDVSKGSYAIINNSRRINFDGNYFEFEGYAGTYAYTAYVRGIPAVSGSFEVG